MPPLRQHSSSSRQSAGGPGGHAQVQAVVATRLARRRLPGGQGNGQGFAAAGGDKVDDRGRAAGQGGAAPRGEIIAGNATGGFQLEVDMGVDAAGKYQAARSVDDTAGSRGQRQARADGDDLFAGRSGYRRGSSGRRRRSDRRGPAMRPCQERAFSSPVRSLKSRIISSQRSTWSKICRPQVGGRTRAGSSRRPPCPAARPR